MVKLPQSWYLPNEIKVRFGRKRSGRQRAMVADGHLLLVLHQAPQRDKREREGVFFWRKPNGEWEYSGRGSGVRRLMEHVEAYSVAEQQLTQEFEQAQDAEDYFRVLQKVAPLHHAAKNLYATLQTAREAIPQDLDLIDTRDWAYDLERALDLLYTDTKNALDFHLARQAEDQSRFSMQSVKFANRLNVLAAIFFPLTAVASVFGMNLPSGFEGGSTGMFWAVFFGGILLGVVISGWALRGAQSRNP